MATHDLALTCQPGRDAKQVFFAYTVTNVSPVELYVMDAFARMDPQSRAYRADTHSAVVVLGDAGVVTLGKFVPPLPEDRQIAMPMLPLATRLAPGAALERRIDIPVPLAEASPYFADLPLRGYSVEPLHATTFVVGYWRADVAGFAAAPAPFAAGFFNVVLPDAVRGAAYVGQRFPTHGLEIFKRGDAFPRALKLHGAAHAAEG